MAEEEYTRGETVWILRDYESREYKRAVIDEVFPAYCRVRLRDAYGTRTEPKDRIKKLQQK